MPTVTVSIMTSFNFAIMVFLSLSLGLYFLLECSLFLAHNFSLKFLSHWCMINTLVEINGTCTCEFQNEMANRGINIIL